MSKKSKKKKAKGNPGADLNDILALEKTIRGQIQELEAGLDAPTANPKAAKSSSRQAAAPLPGALGRHLLNRLTALDAAAARLAQQAEKQGDYKTALKAVQASVRIINLTVRLASRHPELADDWQPHDQASPDLEVSPPRLQTVDPLDQWASEIRAIRSRYENAGEVDERRGLNQENSPELETHRISS